MESTASSGSPDVGSPRAGRWRWTWRRIAVLAAMGGAVGWGLAAWGLYRHGLSERPRGGQWDAIIVLGCRVFADGRPSLSLAARVQAAAELYAEGRAEQIVLTGGVGDAGPAEAEVAAALAESLGVPRSAMVLEDRSASTEQNARFAAQLTSARRVLIVTDAYHVFRSERVFERYFEQVHGVGTISPRLWPRVRGAMREVAAVASYGVRGRL